MSTEAEIAAIQTGLDDTSTRKFAGANAHLKNSAGYLTAGRWAESVRESIHAVESIARILSPGSNTLDPALKHLAKNGRVHTSLQQGFGKLYGFTSDEKGIRHALLDQPEAEIDEADALYMLGACAAFASYLIRKT